MITPDREQPAGKEINSFCTVLQQTVRLRFYIEVELLALALPDLKHGPGSVRQPDSRNTKGLLPLIPALQPRFVGEWRRSEEHTSELQSRGHLVCRLLLE